MCIDWLLIVFYPDMQKKTKKQQLKRNLYSNLVINFLLRVILNVILGSISSTLCALFPLSVSADEKLMEKIRREGGRWEVILMDACMDNPEASLGEFRFLRIHVFFIWIFIA